MKKYILKLKWIIFIKIITAAVSIIGLAAMPYITKLLFDNFSKGWDRVLLYIGMYLLAVIIGMSFEYISQLHAWKLNRECNLFLKKDVFTSIVHLPYLEFRKKEVGEYISIFHNDIKVAEEYVESFVAIIQTSIQIVIYAVYIFILDYRIAMIIMLGSVLALFLPNVTGKTLSSRRGASLDAMAAYSEKIKDLFDGFKHINSITRNSIINHQTKFLYDMEKKQFHYGRFSTFSNVFSGSFMYLVNIACFAAVGVLLLHSQITVGTGIATLGYVESFVFPLSYVLKEINNIKSSKTTKDKLMGLLKELNGMSVKRHPGSLACSKIEFREVTISYQDFVLKKFSYQFEKGKKYAIIGHNGSGKSTILKALVQYTGITSGDILIDDKSMNDCNSADVISHTPSGSHVYNADFENNVTLFGAYSAHDLNLVMKDIDIDKIKSIRNTPNCATLSNGEKQLMEFVRIILYNKEVLLLDEPFSALDGKNTKQLHSKLNEIRNKIIIMVTHDLSEDFLLKFDEILFMDHGTLIVSGDPKMMIQNKYYLELKNTADYKAADL